MIKHTEKQERQSKPGHRLLTLENSLLVTRGDGVGGMDEVDDGDSGGHL